MGFEYHIDIVGKVKHNKNVLWYYDTNGIRYTDADIRRILGLLNEPGSVRYKEINSLVSSRLLQQGIDAIKINMKLRGGKLVSTGGALRVDEVSGAKIYVLCEDSKSGYTFYKKLMEFMFPTVRFYFRTSYGNSTLSSCFNDIIALNDKDAKVIVMTDNKFESPAYRTAIVKIKKAAAVNNVETYIFCPICVEEVITSNTNLQWIAESALGSMVREYLMTGRSYYSLEVDEKEHVNCYILANGSRIKNLEDLMATELSRVSALRYSKKHLGPCYISECCPKYLGGKQFKCNRCNRRVTGCYSFCGNWSLAGAIQNVVNEMLGHKVTNLYHWSEEAEHKLYRRL